MHLKEIRTKIDELDNKILRLLKERFTLMPEVINYKIQNNLEIFDESREQEVLKNKVSAAKEFSMDEKFVTEIYQLIMDQSKEIQKNYLKNLS